MDAFSEAAMRNYEDRLLQYIRQTFSQQVTNAGNAGTRETIRDGIRRARQHDLSTELDVALYIEVMYLLGAGFETDPQHAWAADILRSAGPSRGSGRAKRLHATAVEVTQNS